MNIIKKIYLRAKAYRNLEEAIRKADAAYLKYGTRVYVIPNGNKLAIIDKSSFKRLKGKDRLDGITTMADVERCCFYYTPRYNGAEPISPELAKQKRQQYYSILGLTFSPFEK